MSEQDHKADHAPKAPQMELHTRQKNKLISECMLTHQELLKAFHRCLAIATIPSICQLFLGWKLQHYISNTFIMIYMDISMFDVWTYVGKQITIAALAWCTLKEHTVWVHAPVNFARLCWHRPKNWSAWTVQITLHVNKYVIQQLHPPCQPQHKLVFIISLTMNWAFVYHSFSCPMLHF